MKVLTESEFVQMASGGKAYKKRNKQPAPAPKPEKGNKTKKGGHR